MFFKGNEAVTVAVTAPWERWRIELVVPLLGEGGMVLAGQQFTEPRQEAFVTFTAPKTSGMYEVRLVKFEDRTAQSAREVQAIVRFRVIGEQMKNELPGSTPPAKGDFPSRTLPPGSSLG